MNSKAVRFLVGLVIVFAIFMFAAVRTQAAQNMYDTVVKGEVKIDAGGVLDTGAGTLKIKGTAVTATAAQLNAATTIGITNATLTQSKAAITVVPATYTTNIATYLNATTNAVSSTNVIPATWTVVNGDAVCTNVAITTLP